MQTLDILILPIVSAQFGLIQDNPAFAKLPAKMISLVEGFLKQFEENSDVNPCDMIPDDPNADIDDAPSEVGISLWRFGGNPDLMPAFFHFLSNEAVYILTFDLNQVCVVHEKFAPFLTS